MNPPALDHEWLEADGLGGFAMGTAHGARTRRYHALLQAASTPPSGRFVLVNGMDVHALTPAGKYALSTSIIRRGVRSEGCSYIESFTHEPWPTWRFQLPDGLVIVQDLFVPHGRPAVVVRWRLEGKGPVQLEVRPFSRAAIRMRCTMKTAHSASPPKALLGRLGVVTLRRRAGHRRERDRRLRARSVRGI